MANASLLKNMLDNGVHIGSKRRYWSASMREFIWGVQNGVHVFDLSKTADRLESVKAFLSEMTTKGRTVLVVGTKIQVQDHVREFAQSTGNFFIDTKWVPGLLTNFSTLKKRIQYYSHLEKDFESESLEGFTKKERAQKAKELQLLRRAYEGVKDMKRTPDVLLVVDGYYESLALEEARRLGIPAVALLGSTGNRDLPTHFVPCNVNSLKSVQFILNELRDAVNRPLRAESAEEPSEDAPVRRMGERRGDNKGRSGERRPSANAPTGERRSTTSGDRRRSDAPRTPRAPRAEGQKPATDSEAGA